MCHMLCASGLIPLLATAASALAAAVQQEQQQQHRLPDAPLPAISLAGEVLNLWRVLAFAIADAPQVPTVLSHEQLSTTVGPITH